MPFFLKQIQIPLVENVIFRSTMASERHTVRILFLVFLLLLGNAAQGQESGQTLVQFVVSGIEQSSDMLAVDSTFRSVSSISMVRADYNTRNCVLLVDASMAFRKADAEAALAPLGLDARCYTSESYILQPIIPINPRYCRETTEAATPLRGTGTCCTANTTWGCEDAGCEAVICGLDPFCCSNTWDALCAGAAVDDANLGGPCAGVSDCPGGAATGGACCNGGLGNGSPGCEDAGCEAAVCAIDPFCCTGSWDGLCATTAIDNANLGGACAGVSDCPSGGSTNPCCSAHPFTGCENAACQTFVCGQDAFCCTVQWDLVCVTIATDNANIGGACSGISDCPSGSGNPVTASDCNDAIDVCTDINFAIDPNGFGTVNEIPALGSFGNPDLIPDGTNSAWGTDNWGCLRSGELNSTWMIVNIQTGGTLEFTFGGLGTQAGFYDWIMYPYGPTACSDIANNTVAPVRCNWNAVANGGTGLATTPPPGGNAGNFEPPMNVTTGDLFVICFSNWSSVTTNVPLEFFGSATVSCTPLPVELVTFEGHSEGRDAVLNWTTASEQNNDLFELMRSTDGLEWLSVGKQSGHGFSNQVVHYQHRDPNLAPGIYYFKLHQQDFDGSSKLIGHTTVEINSQSFTAFPNPSSGKWLLTGLSGSVGLDYSLFDMGGQPVSHEERLANETLEIRLVDPQPGCYMLVVRNFAGQVVGATRLMAH